MDADLKALREIIEEEKQKAEEQAKSAENSALLKDSIIGERYRVQKVLMQRGTRNTYLVRDIKITDKRFVIREILPASMPREELRSRRDKFTEIIRILSTFKHNNLIEVTDGFSENNREYAVMEYVDGLNLEKIMEMSTTPFPENKVVEWGLIMCDAIEFMHYRPKPFTLGEFAPDKIMVNTAGDLKITSYDLERFFDTRRTLDFMPDNPEELYDDITKLAQVLYFLLTRKHYDEKAYQMDFPDSISEKMKKLLENTCMPGQKSIGSIRIFAERLSQVMTPEETFDKEKKKFWNFPIHTIRLDPVLMAKVAYEKLASQHIITRTAEVLFLLILIFMGLMHYSHESENEFRLTPEMKVSYIGGGVNMYTISRSGNEIINKAVLGGPVGCFLLVDLRGLKMQEQTGKKKMETILLAGVKEAGLLTVIDPFNNQTVKKIKVDSDPVKIIADPELKTLYVLDRYNSNVSKIDLQTLSLSGLIPTGMAPTDIIFLKEPESPIPENSPESAVYSEAPAKMIGKLPPPKKLPELSGKKALVISNTDSRDVQILDAGNGSVLRRFLMEGRPSSVIQSTDGRFLYVLDTETDSFAVIDYVNNEIIKTIKIPKGEGARRMVPDKVGNRIWITLEKSNAIISYNLITGSFSKIMTISGKAPNDLYMDDEKGILWIVNSGTKDVVQFDCRKLQTVGAINLYEQIYSINMGRAITKNANPVTESRETEQKPVSP